MLLYIIVDVKCKITFLIHRFPGIYKTIFVYVIEQYFILNYVLGIIYNTYSIESNN